MNDGTEWIKNKNDFDHFLRELGQDAGISKFENMNLQDYLTALSGFSEDIDGYYKNNNENFCPNKPTWRIFAQILKAATIYE